MPEQNDPNQEAARYFAGHRLSLVSANCTFSKMNTLIFADRNHLDDRGDIGDVISDLSPSATVLGEDVVPEVGRELRHIPTQATFHSWENRQNRALADLVGDREERLAAKIQRLISERRQLTHSAGLGRCIMAGLTDLLSMPNSLMREIHDRDQEIRRNMGAFNRLAALGNQVIVASRTLDLLTSILRTREELGPGNELLVAIAGADHVNSEVLASLSVHGVRYMVVTQLDPGKLDQGDRELIAEIKAEMPLDRAQAKRIWLGLE